MHISFFEECFSVVMDGQKGNVDDFHLSLSQYDWDRPDKLRNERKNSIIAMHTWL